MPTEQEPQQPLADKLHEQAIERRMEQLLKHIRRGRYVIFLVAMLAIIPDIVKWGTGILMPAKETGIDIAVSLFFFVVFFISRYKPYASLTAASAGFVALTMFSFTSFINSKSNFIAFDIKPILFPLIIFIATFVKLILLFLLVNGAVNGRKYSRLTGM